MKTLLYLLSFILIVCASCKKHKKEEVAPVKFHADGEVSKLYYNGENSVNIVVLGDGFTKEDLQQGGSFDKQSKELIDYLFTVPPFSQNKKYFNTYVVYAESKNRGASMGYDPSGRTKFSSHFSLQTERLLMAGNMDSCDKYIEKALPLYRVHLAVMIVNDATYGGSGGRIAVVSANSLSKYIFVHETGHTFAGLADEYVDEAIADNYSMNYIYFLPNVDVTPDLDRIKWQHILKRPAYQNEVGAFEGAYYRASGVFRPEMGSTMSELRYLNFNAPSREAIVKRIREITGLPFNAEAFFNEDAFNIKPVIAPSLSGVSLPANDFIGIKAHIQRLKTGKR